MEALAIEKIGHVLIDIAIDEIVTALVEEKCCLWSQKKWSRIKKRLSCKDRKKERERRVSEAIKTQDIFDYANKITTTNL